MYMQYVGVLFKIILEFSDHTLEGYFTNDSAKFGAKNYRGAKKEG